MFSVTYMKGAAAMAEYSVQARLRGSPGVVDKGAGYCFDEETFQMLVIDAWQELCENPGHYRLENGRLHMWKI